MLCGCKECLQHGSKAFPWINGKWDEYHVLLIDFTNDTVTMDKRIRVGARFVHPAKFALFMMLNIIVCVDSYCAKDIISVRSLGGIWWTNDVDIGSNGGIKTEVGAGWVR